MKSLSEVENGFAGVLFLIDEIQLEFNSLESKQIDPSVMQEIAQQRKQRKHIVGTSQVFQRIAKPFREQFKYVVQCRKVLGVLQCNTVIDGQSAVVNDDGTIQAASVKTYHWIHKPKTKATEKAGPASCANNAIISVTSIFIAISSKTVVRIYPH